MTPKTAALYSWTFVVIASLICCEGKLYTWRDNGTSPYLVYEQYFGYKTTTTTTTTTPKPLGPPYNLSLSCIGPGENQERMELLVILNVLYSSEIHSCAASVDAK
uniref:Putative secreted mucin n=1 Tax=Amblyomma cajennense TaxID=34607 RepID=A0A023FBN7_AMBCJ